MAALGTWLKETFLRCPGHFEQMIQVLRLEDSRVTDNEFHLLPFPLFSTAAEAEREVAARHIEASWTSDMALVPWEAVDDWLFVIGLAVRTE